MKSDEKIWFQTRAFSIQNCYTKSYSAKKTMESVKAVEESVALSKPVVFLSLVFLRSTHVLKSEDFDVSASQEFLGLSQSFFVPPRVHLTSVYSSRTFSPVLARYITISVRSSTSLYKPLQGLSFLYHLLSKPTLPSLLAQHLLSQHYCSSTTGGVLFVMVIRVYFRLGPAGRRQPLSKDKTRTRGAPPEWDVSKKDHCEYCHLLSIRKWSCQL